MDSDNQSQIEQLFSLGAHLGHKKNRLHPKARKYIYKIINSVSIIDLTKTVNNLEEAKKFLAQAAADSKVVLIVATKKITNQYVANLSKEHQIPYVTTKWLPGLLTNFDTIIKNVRQLKTLVEQKNSGEWEQFVKHERVQLEKKINRLEKFYGGLIYLDKKPDILLILDSRKEKNAVKEAVVNKLPIVSVMDTNSDPSRIDFPIMINDDSPEVVQHVMADLIQAYTKNRNKETNGKQEDKTNNS